MTAGSWLGALFLRTSSVVTLSLTPAVTSTVCTSICPRLAAAGRGDFVSWVDRGRSRKTDQHKSLTSVHCCFFFLSTVCCLAYRTHTHIALLLLRLARLIKACVGVISHFGARSCSSFSCREWKCFVFPTYHTHTTIRFMLFAGLLVWLCDIVFALV